MHILYVQTYLKKKDCCRSTPHSLSLLYALHYTSPAYGDFAAAAEMLGCRGKSSAACYPPQGLSKCTSFSSYRPKPAVSLARLSFCVRTSHVIVWSLNSPRFLWNFVEINKWTYKLGNVSESLAINEVWLEFESLKLWINDLYDKEQPQRYRSEK